MPELAEVEVVRRNLQRWWEGRAAHQVCVFDEQLLRQTPPDALTEALTTPLTKAGRRGKYLLCHFATGQVLVLHFRMTGKVICSDVAEPAYARLSWYIEGQGWLVFKDQRRLGRARLLEADEFDAYEPLQKMGPEPEDVTTEDLQNACTDRRLLKTALLDQSIVAGVGNIAVSEIFWRLKLPPRITCGQLDEPDWQRLVEVMPQYFEEIIERSMADEILYLEEGEMEDIFEVYGHEGDDCPRCAGEIKKQKVGGRSSYFCETCQGLSQ